MEGLSVPTSVKASFRVCSFNIIGSGSGAVLVLKKDVTSALGDLTLSWDTLFSTLVVLPLA